MIKDIITSAVETVNADLPPDMRLALDWTTPILGEGAVIDSMGVVSLLSELEVQLSDQLGAVPELWEEWTGGQEDNPLQTLGSLKAYLERNLVSMEKPKV